MKTPHRKVNIFGSFPKSTPAKLCLQLSMSQDYDYSNSTELSLLVFGKSKRWIRTTKTLGFAKSDPPQATSSSKLKTPQKVRSSRQSCRERALKSGSFKNYSPTTSLEIFVQDLF